MNRIDKTLENLKQQGKSAFVPFMVAGDPDFKKSVTIFKGLSKKADMLEIGFPYTDPLADGPVIQQAHARALIAGMDMDKVFSLIKKVNTLPVVAMVYANVVMAYGIDRFYKTAKQSGVDGVIIPDAPIEEIRIFVKFASEHGIRQIFLITPTTDFRRMKDILRQAEGFLYLVSVVGTTGARKKLPRQVYNLIKKVKRISTIPVMVGFGVSQKKQARGLVRTGAAGVIVGSSLVEYAFLNKGNISGHEFLK